MSETNFSYNDTFKQFNKTNDDIIRSNISSIRHAKNELDKENFLKIIHDLREDTKIKILQNIDQFTKTCLSNISNEEVKKYYSFNPVIFETYIKSLHNANVDFLLSIYDYEANFLKTQLV